MCRLHVSAVRSYPVRLTGGSNVYEGQVEVLYSSAWRTVCASNWDVNEASVTCRQLGIYTSGAGKFTVNLIFHYESVKFIHQRQPSAIQRLIQTQMQ
jgi:hypothetical protein